jgi:hypothetical protein
LSSDFPRARCHGMIVVLAGTISDGCNAPNVSVLMVLKSRLRL